MAAVEPAASGELLSERVAGGILPKVLNSFDMVAIFAAIVLFITNAAVIQTVRLPGLGRLLEHPGAGRTDHRVHPAVGGAGDPALPRDPEHRNLVFLLYGVAIALMLIAGIVHLARGRQAAVDPTALSAWSPSKPTGLNFSNWTFFGLVILALLGVEVPLNMGVEIRHTRSITRYLFWGSLTVMAAYLIATWAVMVTVPAADGRSAQVTAVAEAVKLSLGTFWGNLVALILAGFFLFITVVYNYSFARLIFVSGLDRRLPKAMTHVNANKVPDAGVLAQTIVAVAFTLLAFVILPATSGGGSAVEVQTRVYDVLQAAVTVIWCVSMVVLFIDVLIILRRYSNQFEARRLAHPAVFWVCALIGALTALIGIVSTLSGSWTPLISNDAGTLSVLGAKISYGAWFWWVGGIALASMVVGALLYLLGQRAAASPAPTGAVPAAGQGG
jgi:hypothetical protein